jgi:hypothetical protein
VNNLDRVLVLYVISYPSLSMALMGVATSLYGTSAVRSIFRLFAAEAGTLTVNNK